MEEADALLEEQKQKFEARRKRLKTITSIVAIAMGIFVIGAYFYAKSQVEKVIPAISQLADEETITPTPDPTTDWKSYTDEALAYSLKHPPSMNIIVHTDTLGKKIMFLDSKTAYFSLMEYAFKTNAHVVREETIDIDGKTATLTNLSPDEKQTEANQAMVILKDGNKTFTFFFEKPTLAYQPLTPEDMRLFRQILSTFTFANNKKSFTADWKIYNNGIFTFRYREDLFIASDSTNKTEWGSEYGGSMVLLSQNTEFQKPKVGAKVSYEPYDRYNLKVVQIDKNKQILLDGIEAQTYTYICGIDCYTYDVYFKYKERYFLFRKDIAGGGLKQSFDLTLSTFKFLN